MIACAHQPNYLPWLGTFAKIVRSDCLIVLDSVQYPRRSFVNRVRVAGIGTPVWLTVPVLSKGNYDAPIARVRIDRSRDFAREHQSTLRHRYGRAPFASLVLEALAPAYRADHELLAELNLDLITLVLDLLGVSRHIIRLSCLGVSGQGSGLIAAACRAVGANNYLAGDGAGGYEQPAAYSQSGLHLSTLGFVHPEYPQTGSPDFVPGLSIVDALMQIGPTKTMELLGNAP